MPDSTAHHPRYLRTTDAAVYCGLARATLEKLRLTGEGPAYSKIGRAVLYDVTDLDAWIAACKQTSTSAAPIQPAGGR